MKTPDIGNLTQMAFQKDPRVLAAFSAVKTPEDKKFKPNAILALQKLDLLTLLKLTIAKVKKPNAYKSFGLDVILALKNLDWKSLLKIAFSEPLNARQSREFLDTLGFCYDTERADICQFLAKEIPNAPDLIHIDYRHMFLAIQKEIPNIVLNKLMQDKANQN